MKTGQENLPKKKLKLEEQEKEISSLEHGVKENPTAGF